MPQQASAANGKTQVSAIAAAVNAAAQNRPRATLLLATFIAFPT
jgi:hypothetical protein